MTYDRYSGRFTCDECGNKRNGGDEGLRDWSQTRQEPYKHYCPSHYHLGECNMLTGINVNPQTELVNMLDPTRIVTNEKGGMQSAIYTSLYKVDPVAQLALGEVLGYGAHKYHDDGIPIGAENWRLIPHTEHLDHVEEHLARYKLERLRAYQGLPPDESDEDRGKHLQHAFCRLMFAVATEDNYFKETHAALERNAREKAGS